VALLTTGCSGLPDELKLAARVMFAIEDGYRHRFLRQRYDALAAVWNCDFRTVQRRCDEAIELICRQLNEQPAGRVRAAHPTPVTADAFDQNSWYLEQLSTVVLLNQEQPAAIDVRTMVSTSDGLVDIALPFGMPRHPREDRPRLGIEVDMLYGARLDSAHTVGDNLVIHRLVLPRPLARGERHSFARILRIPQGQLMAPRYIHLALHRCDRFELRVKFDDTNPPRAVWLVAGMPEMVYANHRPGRDRIEPDALGEVHVTFTDLQRGLGYGVSWLPGEE
jgi:hypothetical protein